MNLSAPPPLILPHHGVAPSIEADAFLAPGAVVIGDVEIGSHASIWFGSIVRGDVHWIRIGERTNVQDGSVLHVTRGTHPLLIEDRVTIGHAVVLHGCTLRTGSFIGMGARVLDGAEVGEGAMVGAGALVTPGTVVPPGVLALGVPARVVRPLKPEEKDRLAASADRYVAYAEEYRRLLAPVTPADTGTAPAP